MDVGIVIICNFVIIFCSVFCLVLCFERVLSFVFCLLSVSCLLVVYLGSGVLL